MLRLELMAVFAWRIARATVAAYVVNMARRIPHVLRCQMTQVEPSGEEAVLCYVTQDKTT